jgi:TonB family protein
MLESAELRYNSRAMKILLSVLLLVMAVVTAGSVYGQAVPAKTSDAWVRFESKSKDFSIELPTDYLVDNNGGTVTLYCFGVGYAVSVSMDTDKSMKTVMKEYAARPPRANPNARFFESGDFIGLENLQADVKNNTRSYVLDFASSHGDYRLRAMADDGRAAVVDRIFRSIKLEDKRYLNTAAVDPPEQRVVSVADIKTSDAISTALNQPAAANLKLVESTNLPDAGAVVDLTYSRPVLILRQPRAQYTDSARQRQVSGTVQLYITFQADGTIGSIVLSKSLDKDLDRQAFNAAKQIKFLPAEIGGKPVDVSRYTSYNF